MSLQLETNQLVEILLSCALTCWCCWCWGFTGMTHVCL
jgi:hypothetical protein